MKRCKRRMRDKGKPPRRQPPSEVEIEAPRYRLSLRVTPSHEIYTDDALAFDDEMLDRLAAIQRSWDDTTMWLRSIGVLNEERGKKPTSLIKRLEDEARYRIPSVRVFKIDRIPFGWCEWLHGDYTEQLPPDEFAAEADLACARWSRYLKLGRRFVDNGPPPGVFAEAIGPAYVWREDNQWLYARYLVESPIYADGAVEYSTDEGTILRRGQGNEADFIYDPKREFRNLPE